MPLPDGRSAKRKSADCGDAPGEQGGGRSSQPRRGSKSPTARRPVRARCLSSPSPLRSAAMVAKMFLPPPRASSPCRTPTWIRCWLPGFGRTRCQRSLGISSPMRTTPCVQISRRQLRNAVQDLGDRLAGHGDVLQHMQGEGRWPEDEGIGHQFALPIASRNHGAFAFVLLIWAATKEVPRGTFHSPKHQIIANPLGRKISCQTRRRRRRSTGTQSPVNSPLKRRQRRILLRLKRSAFGPAKRRSKECGSSILGELSSPNVAAVRIQWKPTTRWRMPGCWR
jgi:hypothetical protein